jgi:hypothetical protein
MYILTIKLNKVQFMAIIRLLHSSVTGCDFQGVLWKKGITSPTRQSADWRVGLVRFFLRRYRNPVPKHAVI